MQRPPARSLTPTPLLLLLLVLGTVRCGGPARAPDPVSLLRGALGVSPFTAAGTLVQAHSAHTATLLGDGTVLILGGAPGPFTAYARPAQAGAEIYDPVSGSFTSRPALLTPRVLHTATRLPSNDVLVTGGDQNGLDSLASAELYRPAAGSPSATGSMSIARQAHSATLLGGGDVLIVGGYSATLGGFATSAERYDPASGTFTPTGALHIGRQLHSATLLGDGRVLVAGGYGSAGPLASAEIYDPASRTFTSTGSMNAPRLLHQATSLGDGRVLITGGAGVTLDSLASAEIYDPASGRFTPTGSMSVPRQVHSATLLRDGLVLVAGGSPHFQSLEGDASAELYDPASGSFYPAGRLLHGREHHSATLLGSGAVLLAGGHDSDNALVAELYRPEASIILRIDPSAATLLVGASQRFTATVTGLDNAAVTWRASGGAIAADGRYTAPATPGDVTVTATSVADPTRSASVTVHVVAVPPLAAGRARHTETVLTDGRVLLTGGASQPFRDRAQPTQATAELFDPRLGVFVPTGGMATPRALHTATLLGDGRVLIAGGERTGTDSLASAELYVPSSTTTLPQDGGRFVPTGDLTSPRQGHTATRLANGQVLLAGGYDGTRVRYLAESELYDPATGTFRPTGSLQEARQLHSATLLGDGRVLILGGVGTSGARASAEIYDPRSGLFTAAGQLRGPRLLHGATLLADGRVLVTGGTSGVLVGAPALATCELYSPVTRVSYPAASMSVPRQQHSATLLGDGRALVVGGATSYDTTTTLGSVEIYDPLRRSFTAAAPLVHGRQRHTATWLGSSPLLGDRVLLVAGGHDGDGTIRDAELYRVPEAPPPGPSPRPPIDFTVGRRFNLPQPPRAAAFADFTSDGRIDILATTGTGLSLLAGTDDGTFPALEFIPLGPLGPLDTGPVLDEIDVADLNSDFVPDAVVAAGSELLVVLGNGDGTFQPAQRFPAGPIVDLAIGDLDGDHIPDVAVSTSDPGGVDLLLGNGDGTFQPPVRYPIADSLGDLAIGDLDGDRVPDLAIVSAARVTLAGTSYGGSLSLLLGQGHATFRPPVRIGLRDPARSLALGDVDGNGTLDAVVSGTSSSYLLLGRGDGTFQPSPGITLPTSGRFALGDLNRDRRLDLIHLPGGLLAYVNRGDNTFTRWPLNSVDAGSALVRPYLVDLDGDRQLDAVTLDSASVNVFIGNGDGTFPAPPGRNVLGGQLLWSPDYALVDFDGDGRLDVAAAGGNGTRIVSVHFGNGKGTFPGGAFQSTTYTPTSVAVADFNNDGLPDLAATGTGVTQVSLLLQAPDHTLLPPRDITAGRSLGRLITADFNNDGRRDVAVADLDGAAVLLGSGDGTLQAPRVAAVPGAVGTRVAAADFNDDGRLDLVLASRDASGQGDVALLLGNGDGSFQPARHLAGTSGPGFLVLGDFNGDQITDLVLSSDNTAVRLLAGHGDGTFDAGAVLLTALPNTRIGALIAADLDGDRVLDLAFGEGYGLDVLQGNGDGTFRPVRRFTFTTPSTLAAGDLDGDGRTDLVIAGPSFGYGVLLNLSPSP
ncbi:MAG TPA: FG-GAP-like repeat-containing protein [Polyangia bacterium]|nr:FG-GAP-like repeat-containing protein [Polyangia bacterium]